MTESAIETALARTADELGTPLAMPRAFVHVLERAIAEGAPILDHYTSVMPRLRAAQLAHPLFRAPLDWPHLPRLSAAIDRLYDVLAAAEVPAPFAPTAAAFRAGTPTLAALHERTHFGGFMPMLYGYPADLAYFTSRGLDATAAIDRYLTAPVVHELSHLARDREPAVPPHLDECVAGWLGVHVHPELAYPAAGQDDALFAAPWLAQVGQAFARGFGVAATVRAHAGVAPWPGGLAAAATRLGWDDWRARRSVHLLSDTMAPAPWVALALAASAGVALRDHTLASLAAQPLAHPPPDPAFDRAIVEDALRAMCLVSTIVDGSYRTRCAPPAAPIVVEGGWMTTARRGADLHAPRYWMPPSVAAYRRELGVTALEQVVDLASCICS